MDCIACQSPLSMDLPKEEYWSGLPFPSPEDLPNPGIKSVSPALAGRFLLRHLCAKQEMERVGKEENGLIQQ